MQSIVILLLLGFTCAQSTVITEVGETLEKTAFDPIGLIFLVVMYSGIVAVGVWASKKQKANTAVELALAGRSMSGLMGVITMVATWVCGGYLYGSVQSVMSFGLIWTQAPWCFSICFFFGALLFCKKMREKEYITMFDPFSAKYSPWMTAIMYIPALLGDIFWIGMGLNTLGACLSVLIGVEPWIAVVASAIVSCILAFVGGLYSVAYTDVVQLAIMVICIYMCIPFVWKSELAGNAMEERFKTVWVGTMTKNDWGCWWDYALMMIFGGIPWQVYFQRVLSSKTVKDAKFMSYWSGVGALLCGIAPCVLGVMGVSADWSKTPVDITKHTGQELSYIIKYMTPKAISYIGLAGIAAATLSTADGAYLASSTVFSLNVYKPLFRPHARDAEITLVAKITMIVIATFGALLAVSGIPVYNLWLLTSDLVYVLLFPQLLLVVYFPQYCNTYGSFYGFVAGGVLRILSGDPNLKLPAIIPFPYEAPFRTIAMLLSLTVHLFMSWLCKLLIQQCHWPDMFGAFKPILESKAKPVDLQSDQKSKPVDS